MKLMDYLKRAQKFDQDTDNLPIEKVEEKVFYLLLFTIIIASPYGLTYNDTIKKSHFDLITPYLFIQIFLLHLPKPTNLLQNQKILKTIKIIRSHRPPSENFPPKKNFMSKKFNQQFFFIIKFFSLLNFFAFFQFVK